MVVQPASVYGFAQNIPDNRGDAAYLLPGDGNSVDADGGTMAGGSVTACGGIQSEQQKRNPGS